MKMLKKLLAVVLTGAMALTLLTACGGNAVTEKNIADALNDMAKSKGTNATFTPRAEERELARKIAALLEGRTIDAYDNRDEEIREILKCNDGGANANNFVWVGWALTDEVGTSEQAVQFIEQLKDDSAQILTKDNLTGKNPADTRYMGTALCKMREEEDEDSELVTVRFIVVIAEPKGQEPQNPGKA